MIPAALKTETVVPKTLSKIKELSIKKIGIYTLISFILGRGIFFGSMFPFAVSFFAVMSTTKRSNSLYSIPVLIGIYSQTGSMYILTKYSLVLLGLCLLFFLYYKQLQNSIIKISLYTVTTFLIIASIYQYSTDGMLLYDVFVLITEGVSIFAFTYLFSKLPAILEKDILTKAVSIEEIICISAVLAIAITAFGDIVFMTLRLKYIATLFLILLISSRGSAALGAAVGILAGIIISMTSYHGDQVIGLFGISGVLAGMFSSLPRFMKCITWILSMSAYMFYYEGFAEMQTLFYEIILACLFYLLIPQSKIKMISDQFNNSFFNETMNHYYGDKIRKMVINSLKDYSETFENLAVTYSRAYERKLSIEDDDTKEIIEKIKNRICGQCDFNRRCWQNQYSRTSQILNEIINKADKGLRVENEHIKNEQGFVCINLDKIIFYSQSVVQAYRSNYKWQKKLEGSREITASQFKGLAKSINHLIDEINEEQLFNLELEKKILIKAKNDKLPILNTTVLEGDRGKIISLELDFNEEIAFNMIENFISDSLGEPYHVVKHDTYGTKADKKLTVVLRKRTKYSVTTGASKYAKEMNVCGDSFISMKLKDNTYLIALSDGMGSGEKAARESMLTINTLKHLLEADFDKELALRTMNSMLLLKSTEEIFSTVDITIINLDSGDTSFYKIGAAAAFIKRKSGEVEVIKHSTLPIGIIDKIKIDEIEAKLSIGDMIIMVSDGILEAYPHENKLQWMQDIINKITSKDPQTVSDLILNKAIESYGHKERDDMTVITSKLELTEKKK